jgi:hypothetical protein
MTLASRSAAEFLSAGVKRSVSRLEDATSTSLIKFEAEWRADIMPRESLDHAA